MPNAEVLDRSGEKPYCTFIICIRFQFVNKRFHFSFGILWQFDSFDVIKKISGLANKGRPENSRCKPENIIDEQRNLFDPAARWPRPNHPAS